MNTNSTRPRTITTAQRALIIQRVIVDEWTIGKAAATLGVPERLVAAWVLDYRRYGMASLRDASSRRPGAEFFQVVLSRPARAILRRIGLGVRNAFAPEAAVEPVSLRRSNEDAPH
jgi:hypothetical protein